MFDSDFHYADRFIHAANWIDLAGTGELERDTTKSATTAAISALACDLFLVDSILRLSFERRLTHLLASKKGVYDAVGVVAAQLR